MKKDTTKKSTKLSVSKAKAGAAAKDMKKMSPQDKFKAMMAGKMAGKKAGKAMGKKASMKMSTSKKSAKK